MKRRGVTVLRQRHDWDCGVACLSMLLDVPYGDVIVLVRETIDERLLRRRGMTIADVQDIAELLCRPLEVVWRRNGFLLERRTGILGVKGGRMDKAGHWVVLKSGPASLAIVDPDGGTTWDATEYLSESRARPTMLLTEVE